MQPRNVVQPRVVDPANRMDIKSTGTKGLLGRNDNDEE